MCGVGLYAEGILGEWYVCFGFVGALVLLIVCPCFFGGVRVGSSCMHALVHPSHTKLRSLGLGRCLPGLERGWVYVTSHNTTTPPATNQGLKVNKIKIKQSPSIRAAQLAAHSCRSTHSKLESAEEVAEKLAPQVELLKWQARQQERKMEEMQTQHHSQAQVGEVVLLAAGLDLLIIISSLRTKSRQRFAAGVHSCGILRRLEWRWGVVSYG